MSKPPTLRVLIPRPYKPRTTPERKTKCLPRNNYVKDLPCLRHRSVPSSLTFFFPSRDFGENIIIIMVIIPVLEISQGFSGVDNLMCYL